MTAADFAAIYAAHGWNPVAIIPSDKRPLLTGWQARPLGETLSAISANPGANVGIAVPAGHMVLDVDCKAADGFASLALLEAKHGKLPDSLTASTPSGGWHIWLRLPPGVTVRNAVGFAPGLDVRTAGGFVVAAPSVIGDKPYVWKHWDGISAPIIADAPGWLIDETKRPAPLTLKASPGEPFAVPNGTRNRTLFDAATAMRKHGFDNDAIAPALLTMNAKSCNPPLEVEEVARIAASAVRYEPDMQPWQIFGKSVALPPGAIPTPQKRFNLLNSADLAALPPLAWAIRGVLPAEGLASIYGASGSGKSFLVLDMMLGLAAGRAEWFGHAIKEARPVVYAALEGEGGISGRVKAHRARHGDSGASVRYLLQPFNLLNPADVENLAVAIIESGCASGVLILDTLNRAAPGADENDSRNMGQIIAAAKALQILLGGLVLLVAHSGKDATKGLRGHSSLHAALDAAIEVNRDGDRRTWRLAKSKDDADGVFHPFTLNPVVIGKNDQGEIETSCVVAPAHESAEALARVKLPSGGNQRIAWDALREMLTFAEQRGQGGAPADSPCIQLETAIEKVRGKLAVAPDKKTARARDAITGLVNRGCLILQEGWIWAA